MNLLTTAATAGILVLVFQDGNLTGLLGFTKPEGIEQTDFLVLVAIERDGQPQRSSSQSRSGRS